MPQSTIPLPLFKVLEEEYVALYGTPEVSALNVRLPDPSDSLKFRDVNAQFGWDFDITHLKDWSKFKKIVSNAKSLEEMDWSLGNPEAVARKALRAFLVMKMGTMR